MYDLIGDIHGHAGPLKRLLTRMGYSHQHGCWQHPDSRKVIFVGDFIDRGPAIRETLGIVKAMVDHEQALAIMGNHEYNAIAYDTQREDGSFLRSHNDTHRHQHKETLAEFSGRDEEWKKWLAWFRTLPLFLDLGDLRVVHACWDQDHISWLKASTNGKLTDPLLVDAHVKGSTSHTIIEETLKGKEIRIDQRFAWPDKDGHPRTSNRIKWWVDPRTSTHHEFLFNCPEQLRNEAVPHTVTINRYPSDGPPVFFGHYWLDAKEPVIQAANVACLDYSVARGGSLVGYRWNGEKILTPEHFITISPDWDWS